MSINMVCISGNLVADAEVRPYQEGREVLSFSVAVNESMPDGNGGWTSRASFFRCARFGNVRGVAPYLTKGTHVTISGRLRQSRWEKDGERRTAVEIIVGPQGIDFASPKSARGASMVDDAQEAENPPAASVPEAELYDEDVPF